MIIGFGIDMCDIDRINNTITSKISNTFLKDVFSKYEQDQAAGLKYPAAFLAKRFAAKEAFAKALGTGFNSIVKPYDIIVKNDRNGVPTIVVRNGAQESLSAKIPFNKICNIHLSLSKQSNMAIASVIIESL